MNRTITLLEKNVYGTLKYYPIGEYSDALIALTGKTSLDPRDVRCLDGLGFKLVVTHEVQAIAA